MWAQIAAALVGLWLMVSPSVLEYGEPARTNSLIAGPIAVSMAVIAIWEIGRSLRWVNVLIGVWLLIAPLILGFETESLVNSMVAGALLAGFSLIRGQVSGQYGGGWKSLFSDDAPQGDDR